MHEFTDIEVYIGCLEGRVRGAALEALRLANPFFLRTGEPPLSAAAGPQVATLSRMENASSSAFKGASTWSSA